MFIYFLQQVEFFSFRASGNTFSISSSFRNIFIGVFKDQLGNQMKWLGLRPHQTKLQNMHLMFILVF